MPCTFTCPYFKWEEGLCLHCEAGRIKFKDYTERREYIYRYCAVNPGWESCTLAQNITRRYERTNDGKKHRQDKTT